MKQEATEFEKFDAAIGKVLSVSHKELQAREKKWKRQQIRKKNKAGLHK